MTTETDARDVVVVGGGTAGCFAAATAARNGLDVALLERKTEAEAGHIACGDGIKGKSTFPDVIDRERLKEESFTNRSITRGIFENPRTGETLEIPFGESGAVVDRWQYGQVLLDETERAGAEIHYETVVNDVIQPDERVEGVVAVRDGDPIEYEAEVVVDAAGALSVLQDRADLTGSTFDTNIDYSQFCSAYREVLEVPEPVDWADALVFKPTEELGYLWYFPRSATEINAGLGFQMSEEPMHLVDALRADLTNRAEFADATVTDKLGAALPTRRPLDSAVHPGFVAVGDAAAHVNPCTGGGIPGAAKAGHWAAEVATEAIADGDVSEAALWPYNERVQTGFGKRFAAMDCYNIFGTAHDLEELVSVVTAIPGQQLIDAIGKTGTAEMGLGLKLKTLLRTVGHWDVIYELYRVQRTATSLKDVYDSYPSSPDGFDAWRAERDSVMDRLYEITGAAPKY
ncbi:electron transfer flavoprotein [Halobiforma lacisalsi AJ5]|uniref:Electron transfer flavoprotein n=1 Tax=Natronobacterium lacisalsi AJ5 TaxID=358396 RepID=M0LAY6_NATLA|nr:geranylgeranyl reductase family protein [Halobiforma lacisalsi]APW99167.1 electron transfer flavoprotein [Halobiforma lacisalsi AJ5]EMA30732.1 geranylgeranyl reductase [Halobiforma lacisalsi AJ5]